MLRGILLAAIVAVSGSAFAQTQSIKVSGKERFKGTQKLRLRALTNQQLTAQGENPDHYELVGVTMKAKAKNNDSYATLIVGPDREKQQIGKAGGLVWDISAPWTFDNMRWDLSSFPGQSDERWQMRFDGNIKIRELHVHVRKTVERVRIPFGGELFKKDSVIRLKQELRAMGYNVRDAKLSKVVLVAKSRRGNGTAQVITGGTTSRVKTIGMAPVGVFGDEQPRTYNRIQFNPKRATPGKWQIHMRGRIKVKAVIVEFN